MTRQLAELILKKILAHMRDLQPYVNDEANWKQAIGTVETIVFIVLPGDPD